MIHAAADLAPDRGYHATALVALDAHLRHLEQGMGAFQQVLETLVPSSQQTQQPEPQQQSSPPQPSISPTVVARLQALEESVFASPHPQQPAPPQQPSQPPSPPTGTTELQQPTVQPAKPNYRNPGTRPPSSASCRRVHQTICLITRGGTKPVPAGTDTPSSALKHDTRTKAADAAAIQERPEQPTLSNHDASGPPSLLHEGLKLSLQPWGGGAGESDAEREGLGAGTVSAAPAHEGAAGMVSAAPAHG